ncbi:MAG: sterol desaturase family protein [Rhizobacter sp.]|nr:sterol desaturase family protein [Burkholderiales bacterium]
MEFLEQAFESLVGGVYTTLVDPTIYSLGLMSWAERAFDATAFFVGGLLQVIATAALCLPLERVAPAQTISDQRHVRTDVLFTFANKVGLFPLFAFAALWVLFKPFESWLRLQGVTPWSLEDLWPALAGMPGLSLLFYIVILDLAGYWLHRAQHQLNWWWQLHALHHAQRDMTFWTDDRNHIADELLSAFWMAMVALAIGVPPQQFPLLLFATKFMESLSHANIRWNFGPLKYLLVSPQFHRVHHAISIGHEGQHRGVNFAVVFSFWDKLFATADFRDSYPATGVADQLHGRHYGDGFWETQWLGFVRLKQYFRSR